MTFPLPAFAERLLSRRTSSASTSPVDELRFHIDRPDKSGLIVSRHSRFNLSGWVVGLATSQKVNVRICVRDGKFPATNVTRHDVQEAFRGIAVVPAECGFSGDVLLPPGLVDVAVEAEISPANWLVLVRQSVLCLSLERYWSRAKKLQSSEGGYFFHVDQPHQTKVAFVSNKKMLSSGWAVDVQTATRTNVKIKLGNRIFYGDPKVRSDVKEALASLCVLPLECGFEKLLALKLGVQKFEIFVETREKTWRSIYRIWLLHMPWRRANDDEKLSHSSWKQIDRKLRELQFPEVRDHIKLMVSRPSFTVIVQSMQAMDIATTLASLSRQLYPAGQVLVCGAAAEHLPSAAAGVFYLAEVPWKQLQGDFVLFLRAGDILRDDALYQFASLINREADAELIYTDEERSSGTDVIPFFKPSWSPDYLETFNYIGRSACFRVEVANQIEQPLNHYDFVLQFTEVAKRIHHIDQIMVKCSPADNGRVVEANKAALERRLKRTGRRGVVEVGNESGDFFRVSVAAANRPLVSIVIPTAGQIVAHDGDDLDLILNCVSQIREKSSYTNVEVIVVDNGNLSSHQTTVLDRLGCRRTTFTESKFNVAKKLNLGADLASGDFLLLLNDDIEILSTDWIERLLEHFEKPHVGVVGPKLLYRDLTTQHVGVVLNSGNPDHVRRLFPRDDEGYFFSTCGVRNYIAVTGACMMTRRTVYEAVGGYSEELAVSYNDTDFCMKVGELGLSTVYTPYAELIHFESQSRVAKLDLDEAYWFQQTWAKRSTTDDYYNERFLSVASPTFRVEVNPRLL